MARQREEDYARHFLPDGAPTLATVLSRIEADRTLTPRAKTGIRSALNKVDEIHGHVGLDAIPADAARFRATFNKVAPAAYGITAKTWSNVRSNLRKALRIAGITRQDVTIGLTGRWADLWHAVLASGDAGLKAGLTRFPRYCQSNGIEPERVTSATIRDYEAARAAADLDGNPHAKAAAAAQAWNRARSRIPGWPQIKLKAEDRSNTYSLGWKAFPAALERDVDAWLAISAGDDLFADDGPARPLAPSTVRSRKGAILRAASAAVMSGVDPMSLDGLAALVEIDTVKRALSWIYETRLDKRRTGTLANIAMSLRNAAKWHARVDERHLAALDRIVRQASPKSAGAITEKNRTTLEAFKDQETLWKLLDLPAVLMREAARKDSPRTRATLRETALAIALLTYCPVRSANLLSIEIDRHFLRHRHGRKLRTLLHFPAAEVKNRQDLTFELPEALASMVDDFVASHRPVLAAQPGAFLFAGRERAGPLDKSALARRITRAITRHVGVRMTLHQFRHLAILIYGTFHRNDFEAMRLLLGHAGTTTVTRYYAMIETDAVHRAYAAVLKSLLEQRRD